MIRGPIGSLVPGGYRDRVRTCHKQSDRSRPIADISVLRQISCVSGLPIKMMRASLWLLFAAATIVAMFWMMLVLASGFEVWRESNQAGLALQAAA